MLAENKLGALPTARIYEYVEKAGLGKSIRDSSRWYSNTKNIQSGKILDFVVELAQIQGLCGAYTPSAAWITPPDYWCRMLPYIQLIKTIAIAARR